jgi:hypothetical protein
VIGFESTMPISNRRLAVRAYLLSPGTRGSALPISLILMIGNSCLRQEVADHFSATL